MFPFPLGNRFPLTNFSEWDAWLPPHGAARPKDRWFPIKAATREEGDRPSYSFSFLIPRRGSRESEREECSSPITSISSEGKGNRKFNDVSPREIL